MNRRNFLKSIATVCGAAVVCPGELVKGKTEHEILLEKFRAAALNTKDKNNNSMFKVGAGGQIIYRNINIDFEKARALLPWKYISIPFHYET